MKAFRKIALLLLILLVVMQFVQPTKNISTGISNNDISKVYAIPAGLHNILVEKCYDCHSNNTRYPWYASVQPVGWWLAAHVYGGKERLNFSEFKNYTPKKATHELQELSEVIENGSMPLALYITLHKDSKITQEDADAINNWLTSLNVSKNTP
jgi:hypothetical protein